MRVPCDFMQQAGLRRLPSIHRPQWPDGPGQIFVERTTCARHGHHYHVVLQMLPAWKTTWYYAYATDQWLDVLLNLKPKYVLAPGFSRHAQRFVIKRLAI